MKDAAVHADVVVTGEVTEREVVFDHVRGRTEPIALHHILVTRALKGTVDSSTIYVSNIVECFGLNQEYVLFLEDVGEFHRPDDPEQSDSPSRYVDQGPFGTYFVNDGIVTGFFPGLMDKELDDAYEGMPLTEFLELVSASVE